MPVLHVAIDPVTRIEGHLKVEIAVDTLNGVQQVVDAHCVGTLFRGFERILAGRDPRDAPIITSRVCGVCPTSHALAAVLALDRACNVLPPETARLMRNLVHGACYLESHLLHFYLLCLPDFIRGPAMAPWQPRWDVGDRFDAATAALLLQHYLAAIDMRRKAHEMGAVYGGKLPHTPAYIAGGFTAVAHAEGNARLQALLTEITAFIEGTYLPDVERVAAFFPEYFTLGKGCGNLLSFGVYEEDAAGTSKLFRAGRMPAGAAGPLPVDVDRIIEHVRHAWYDQATTGLNPAQGETVPQYPKPPGYSWLKAPRYDGAVYECGPLARMTVNGWYQGGVSVMDRHRARAHEALRVAHAMETWLAALPVQRSAYVPCALPATAETAGLTEAPRGALGHWLRIENGKIAHYQIVTPTCWNLSPRDDQGTLGTLEQALVGTPIQNVDQPLEALRVIHSIDPCLDCATHVVRPDRIASEREGART
ncbi:MAG: nickel-dependent hydrogenase large subunit [Lentisphaerae bacterium]|nr:nickel-dependent hydrogenase large subunit [Lentisphaerota bacterium]